MTKVIDAIFENGVLKPKESPEIPEHQRVTLIIEDVHEKVPDVPSLASKVYSGLSPEDIEDIEKIATNNVSSITP